MGGRLDATLMQDGPSTGKDGSQADKDREPSIIFSSRKTTNIKARTGLEEAPPDFGTQAPEADVAMPHSLTY
jgi:hypothetical protein